MTRVLLATSNGVGMGHLTRQAAVGLALEPEHEATLFSMSPGLPLAAGLGLAGEYCPSYERPWIDGTEWHAYLRDRIVAIVEETGSEVLLFDGVAPYPGIGAASLRLRDVAFVWLRRGMWLPGTGAQHLRKSAYFDMVVEPGDLASVADQGPTTGGNVVPVAPMSLLEVLDPLARDEARRSLGLPDGVTIALVTLGSGMLGDVVGPGGVTLDWVLGNTDWHVAVTRPAVATNELPVGQSERVHVISGVYPLARYLSAFDIAVSSAGYNAVHELIPAGIPTVLVANMATRTDDQWARASRLAAGGLALAARDSDRDGLTDRLSRLSEGSFRASLAGAAAATRSSVTGAVELAGLLADTGASHGHREQRVGVRLSLAVRSSKERLKRVLGPKNTNRIRRVLGRPPIGGGRVEVEIHEARPEVDGGILPLLLTEHVDVDLLRSEIPVEHLLPGRGEAYRRRREEIVADYYDVLR